MDETGIHHTQPSKDLKEGFTTGTAASAAALAALTFLLTGKAPDTVLCPLPPITPYLRRNAQAVKTSLPLRMRFSARDWKKIAISDVFTGYSSYSPSSQSAKTVATALVIKNGGDDPDATHNARIFVSVALNLYDATEEKLFPTPPPFGSMITFQKGTGVGTVTLPGLPLPPGALAINPFPRAQLRYALLSLWEDYKKGPMPPTTVTICVPDGESIAKKTFNPRLGIVGGISILGTQGTVKPFSHEAFTATITASLKQAKALGLTTLYFSTGRRSERLLQKRYQEAPPQAFIQVADFSSFALHTAHSLGFSNLIWGCFFGKLVKLAQGLENTNAKNEPIDFAALASFCQK
ncbi:MAG: cobalt-precorrin-5B (C(1))-methyltransferase, partial [Desulfovibrio sp.]|nr:cobalt-precorrin-5B (C(1))-methyltransferase [Desulfovibrio sp.]